MLGAWGCGAFRQDKSLISKAFVDVLNDYSGYFKEIVFVIKDTPSIKEYDTFDIFVEAFKDYRGPIYSLEYKWNY